MQYLPSRDWSQQEVVGDIPQPPAEIQLATDILEMPMTGLYVDKNNVVVGVHDRGVKFDEAMDLSRSELFARSFSSKQVDMILKHRDLYFPTRIPTPRSEPTITDTFEDSKNDPVNHPAHYTAYKGVEVIQLTRHMNFNRGNAVKYVARAGLKDKNTEIQDLEKAIWYLQDEIAELKGEHDG